MAWANWKKGNRFRRMMPIRPQLLCFAGTFLVFLPTGLVTDVSALGATPSSSG